MKKVPLSHFEGWGFKIFKHLEGWSISQLAARKEYIDYHILWEYIASRYMSKELDEPQLDSNEELILMIITLTFC